MLDISPRLLTSTYIKYIANNLAENVPQNLYLWKRLTSMPQVAAIMCYINDIPCMFRIIGVCLVFEFSKYSPEHIYKLIALVKGIIRKYFLKYSLL